MTYEATLNEAVRMAKQNKLVAYVHTCPAFGFNFRFLAPIESTGEAGNRKTVARIEADGAVFKMKGAI